MFVPMVGDGQCHDHVVQQGRGALHSCCMATIVAHGIQKLLHTMQDMGSPTEPSSPADQPPTPPNPSTPKAENIPSAVPLPGGTAEAPNSPPDTPGPAPASSIPIPRFARPPSPAASASSADMPTVTKKARASSPQQGLTPTTVEVQPPKQMEVEPPTKPATEPVPTKSTAKPAKPTPVADTSTAKPPSQHQGQLHQDPQTCLQHQR